MEEERIDHVILVGPPGSGKTTWARGQSVVNDLSRSAEADIGYVYRAAGIDCAVSRPPFRAPHHTVSLPGFAGKVSRGYQWRPGELSLAHGGILFLDELTEFRPEVLEALREPLRTGRTCASDGVSAVYPARFRLIGAMNRCPCGWLGSPRPCGCSPEAVRRHLGRVPGWLRDLVRYVDVRRSG